MFQIHSFNLVLTLSAIIILHIQSGLGDGALDKIWPFPEPTLSANYGPDFQQTLDLFVPANNPESSKVIVLIHGGAWITGDKIEMNPFVTFLQATFPNYTIANINYRWGTFLSPGNPKQLEDIGLALQFIKSNLSLTEPEFVLFGSSAGAHIAMMYAYQYDTNSSSGVKALVDIVGPVDFTDPPYKYLQVYNLGMTSFAGLDLFLLNPKAPAKYSPATFVTRKSPPTILFYGTFDPAVPPSQGPILKAKLDAAEVPNELHMYPGTHYTDWSASSKANVNAQIANFLINFAGF